MTEHFSHTPMAQYSDEIDLFELAESLWRGKVTILACALVSCLLFLGWYGVAYQELWSSEMILLVDNDNDNDNDNDYAPVYKKMQALFFDAGHFQQWHAKQENVHITYAMISPNKTLDGFTFAKTKKERFVSFVYEKKSNSAGLTVRFNSLDELRDVSGYASYINAQLTESYLSDAQKSLSYIEQQMAQVKEGRVDLVNQRLRLKRFIEQVKSGRTVILVASPSLPKKVTNPVLIGGITVFFGFALGCLMVLFLHMLKDYQHRKELRISNQTSSIQH